MPLNLESLGMFNGFIETPKTERSLRFSALKIKRNII